MKYPPILPTNCHFCGASIFRRATKSGQSYCNIDCKSRWQRTQKPVSREWLVDHYVTQGLDTSKIAKIVKRDPKSVWNWLKDLEIPTRPRGGLTLPHAFQKGQLNAFAGRHHSDETKKKMSDHAKAVGRVPYDPAVGSYMKGRKGADTPNWKGGITAERQSVYASQKWKAAVVKVWKRDCATCQRCAKKKNEHRELPFDIHHIKSFEVKRLRCTVSNLVLLCEPCHYWVHSKANKKDQFICR